jgi:hypothetical protein
MGEARFRGCLSRHRRLTEHCQEGDPLSRILQVQLTMSPQLA